MRPNNAPKKAPRILKAEELAGAVVAAVCLYVAFHAWAQWIPPAAPPSTHYEDARGSAQRFAADHGLWNEEDDTVCAMTWTQYPGREPVPISWVCWPVGNDTVRVRCSPVDTCAEVWAEIAPEARKDQADE